MVKVDQELEKKLLNLDRLQKWGIVVSAIDMVVVILYVVLLLSIPDLMTMKDGVPKNPMGPTIGSIAYLIVFAAIIFRIIVGHTNKDIVIRNFYKRAGLGLKPFFISLFGIVIFPIVMSIILYSTTHEALTNPSKALDK